MKFAFRVDASLQIGTGHVMRCLTLADALVVKGADCQFFCREHEGNLVEFIRRKGYVTHVLPIIREPEANLVLPTLAHSQWLGATQRQDADACASIIAAQEFDWLIVDHYALDARWEYAMAPFYRKLMVIDDLADRSHACDLLLDQTFGREGKDYGSLVPTDCSLLCGSQYALLRPEFAAMRHYSMRRRVRPILREILITMGGVDKDNATGQVLEALCNCSLPADCRITVVMGSRSPWLDDVRKKVGAMSSPVRVLIDVNTMAQLMADSDLAVGAAGTTSWERCCLGLPTVMVVLAENQKNIAEGLVRSGAARIINFERGEFVQIRELLLQLKDNPAELLQMSNSAARIVNGSGVNTVISKMEL